MEICWKRPELPDKELITSYFKKYPSRNCERTFSNVYLWSRRYDVTFSIVDECLVFRMGDNPFVFSHPTGEAKQVKKAVETLRQYAKEHGEVFGLYNLTPQEFAELEEWFPGEFEITYDRDYADYVYETEKLISLQGKKLHAKRNHINKFKAENPNWSYHPMTENDLEECFQMTSKWCKDNGCFEDEDKRAEMCVTRNALRLFKELELVGGILKVDKEIIAFTIGEELCEDTFVTHIEKAHASVQGAYPMINQQFAEHACKSYQYINREEDTGAEGLRKAKLSYRPVFLVEKGIAKEKQQ